MPSVATSFWKAGLGLLSDRFSPQSLVIMSNFRFKVTIKLCPFFIAISWSVWQKIVHDNRSPAELNLVQPQSSGVI